MDVCPIYLETRPEEIAYVKFIFESYEEVGIVRTIDRSRALIVVLAVPDYLGEARRILEGLKSEAPIAEVEPPADLPNDWLMAELARSDQC
ncbi:MAG TPA: DUF4911 domain-containing protein [Candidatus Eisenbacteria bacterium]|nr:DUF4911 domain-containing protein [Candidatus Eisenbacteria bacterium]